MRRFAIPPSNRRCPLLLLLLLLLQLPAAEVGAVWERPGPRSAGTPLIREVGAVSGELAEGWNLFDTDHDGVFEAGETRPGEGVVVAVIDSGIDASHSELAANIWTNPNETANGADDDGNGLIDDVSGWDFVEGDRSPQDGNGHGTHVAGTIAVTADNATGLAGICAPSRRGVVRKVD